MALLSGKKIKKYLNPELPISKRLVIVPILDKELQIAGNSIDLRLGNRFYTKKRTRLLEFDPRKQGPILLENSYLDRHYLPLGKTFILHPGHTILSSTLEYLKLPSFISGEICERASWSRYGLTLATRPFLTPNHHGCVSLEITNTGAVPIVLYPTARIIQLKLYRSKFHEKPIVSDHHHSTGPLTALRIIDQEAHLWADPPAQLVVGITGPMFAGKTTVALHLQKTAGFAYFSLSHFLHRELKRQGNTTLNSMDKRTMANSLREKFGNDYLIQKLMPQIRNNAVPLVVVDGIVHPDEAKALSDYCDFFLIGIDSDPDTRHRQMENLASIGSANSLERESFVQLDNKDMGNDQPEYAQQIRKTLDLSKEWQKIGKGTYLNTDKLDNSVEELLTRIDNLLHRKLQDASKNTILAKGRP